MSETTKVVKLEPHNPEWKHWFVLLKSRVLSEIADADVTVEHYGSTSVEGLMAKPRIDMVIIHRGGQFLKIKTKLSKLGYNHVGDQGIMGRECFKLMDNELIMKLPTHNMYVCSEESEELARMLKFRDILRSSSATRREYQELKLKLAELYPNDVNAYASAKSDFITNILK